jgi:hypothetical protein
MKSYKFHILSLTTLLLLGATTHAEAKIFERKKKKAQTEVKAAPAKQNINGLKPYAQVITPKAKSSFGFLTVHKVDNNYFFEIPDSMLNRDILIVNRISKAPTSRQKSRVGYPGDILGSKVIRFENKDNKRILVREYSYRERSENKDGMFQSVRNSNTQPIVANFGIETINDIIAELEKPGRDPRKTFETLEFDNNIRTINDLKQGMQLYGIVTNITAFGAFVDIGVHQDGLVHISQMSDKYITDPNEVVKLNQKVRVTVTDVDIPRKRISLSMK